MRNAAVDTSEAARLGVTVCGVPGSSPATAELAWALLLALVRSVPARGRRVRAGRWQSTVGTGLAGRTLGIVGLGRLGTRWCRWPGRSAWTCSPGAPPHGRGAAAAGAVRVDKPSCSAARTS
jgi:hypothetical protein